MPSWIGVVIGAIIGGLATLAGTYLQNRMRTDKHSQLLFEKRLDGVQEILDDSFDLMQINRHLCDQVKYFNDVEFDTESDKKKALENLKTTMAKSWEMRLSARNSAWKILSAYFPETAIETYVQFDGEMHLTQAKLMRAIEALENGEETEDIDAIEKNIRNNARWHLLDGLRKGAGIVSAGKSTDNLLSISNKALREKLRSKHPVIMNKVEAFSSSYQDNKA